MLLAAVMLLPACSGEKWTAGPAEEETMGVYFGLQPQYSYVIEPDEDHVIKVSMNRAKDDAEATVPLKAISCPEGVVLPESVTFPAGSSQQTIFIDCTGMAIKTSGKIVLAIDPAYSSVYAAGSSTIELGVNMTGAWLEVADDVTVTYETPYPYPEQKTKILMLDGTDQFKIPNFLNSGVDLLFRLSDPGAQWPDVVPYKNVMWYSEVFPDDDDEYTCWYLYDSDNETYPKWSPDGSEPLISFAQFYGAGFSYIGINDGYGYFAAYADYTDGSGGWFYAHLNFTPLFNPFAE